MTICAGAKMMTPVENPGMREHVLGERAAEALHDRFGAIAIALLSGPEIKLHQIRHHCAVRVRRRVVERVNRGGGRRRLRFARAIGVEQPPILGHLCTDEIEGPLGRLEPFDAHEDVRRFGEPRDREPVPAGEHLVVGAGPDAARAGREQLGPQLRQLLLPVRRAGEA